MKPSNEQLIFGLKMALATFEAQLRIDGEAATAFHTVVDSHHRIQDLLIDAGVLVAGEQGPDLNPLLRWAADQLTREIEEQ